MRTLSIQSNFSWQLAGNVVLAISQWGILVVLAKIGNPHMIGQFTFGLAVTAPVIFFTNMSLSKVLSTDTSHMYEFRDYFGLRIVMNILAVTIVVMILIIIGLDLQQALIVFVIGISKVVESTSNIFHGLYQKNERMDYTGISYMIKGPTSLCAMGIFLWLTNSLLIAVTALSMSWLLILIVYEFPLGRRFGSIRPRFITSNFRKLLTLSFPLGIVALLLSLIPNIPRYFIEYFLGSEALGYFAAIVYIMAAYSTIINALGESIIPRLAHFYSNSYIKQYQSLIMKVLLVVIGISLGSIVGVFYFGKFVLTILYDSSYVAYSQLLFQLMIAALFISMSTIIEYGITAARIFRLQTVLFTMMLIIKITLSYYFISRWGLEGSAYTIILWSICQLIGSSLIYLYAIRKKRSSKTIESTEVVNETV